MLKPSQYSANNHTVHDTQIDTQAVTTSVNTSRRMNRIRQVAQSGHMLYIPAFQKVQSFLRDDANWSPVLYLADLLIPFQIRSQLAFVLASDTAIADS